MDAFLARVPLVGPGPVLVISAIALFLLVLGLMTGRHHRVLSRVLVALAAVVGLVAVADYVNTRNDAYVTAADLFGIPDRPLLDEAASSPTTVPPQPTPTPTATSIASVTPQPTATTTPAAIASVTPQPTPTTTPTSTPTTTPTVTPQPDGAVQTIQVPDPASHFGAFDAKVWLPPQYFSDPSARFPVVVLIHGNPGLNTDWLTSGNAAATALAGAKAGKPVILVMPTVLQDHSFGDSLCLDTASQGNAETYVTQDLVAAVDGQLRTKADPTQRGIGGLSMGGYCALNLGLKHPDIYSVVLDFSGDTVPTVDTLPGGLAQLFGPAYQKSVDANTPATYLGQLDAKRGPALWIDVGQSDGALKEISGLVPLLKNKGFTVQFHTRPGAHDFTTFGNALADALPWAAGRFFATP